MGDLLTAIERYLTLLNRHLHKLDDELEQDKAFMKAESELNAAIKQEKKIRSGTP